MRFLNSKPKVFCIGLNKTGTTSLGTFLENEGLLVARQREGERLLPKYINREFTTILKYCKKSKAQVFQDVPFSLPYTFIHLHNAFPESKFILTVRDSDIQWYNSILKFHSDKFNNGRMPTEKILKESKYLYKGWAWDLVQDVYFRSKNDLYDQKDFTSVYNTHNLLVKEYFKNHQGNLLIVNLAQKDDLKKLCEFLNIKTDLTEFPRITSNDILNKNYSSTFLR